MYVGGRDRDAGRGSPGPTIGVVTAVRPVHLSRAGPLEAIERREGGAGRGAAADGTAVLNADDPRVRPYRGAHARGDRSRYGFGAGADVPRRGVASRGAAGMAFTLVALPRGERGRGRDRRRSAATASTTRWPPRRSGSSPGMPDEASPRAWPPAGHGRRTAARSWTAPGADDPRRHVQRRRRPPMLAALDLLAGLPGRRVAVLGRDAGARRRPRGRATARWARPRAAVAELVVVGERRPRSIADGARAAGLARRRASVPCPTAAAAIAVLLRCCGPATSSWSRRRGAWRSRRSWTACSGGRASARVTVELIQGDPPRVRARRDPHAALHPAAALGRVRQADPRGGAESPPGEGGHADAWAALLILVVVGVAGPGSSTWSTPRPSRRWPRSRSSACWAPSTTTSTPAPATASAAARSSCGRRSWRSSPPGRSRARTHITAIGGAVRRAPSASPTWLYICFAAFAIVAMSNGVNLTDGLDGLAGGTLIFAFVGS